MCWRRRAWMPMAAMSPCQDTAMASTCIMAATILPIRTGSPAPCRVTGPKTWRRITSSAIQPKAMPSGAGSPSASAWPRSCARSCRKRYATCSTACARPQIARSGQKGRTHIEIPSQPRERPPRIARRLCGTPEPTPSSAMLAPWTPYSAPRMRAARPARSR